MIPQISDSGINLLSQLLILNPAKRITAKKALTHPWFS
jgi:serine/threonine protein kinase